MNTEEIIAKALTRPLSRGSHDTPESGACIMEALSWAAGEPWSDFPRCVERDVAKHCQTIHDAADPADYSTIWTPDRLRGVLGAERGLDAIRGRAYIAAEYARRAAVEALREQGRDVSAIEACAPVTDRASAIALRDALRAYAAAYANAAASVAGYAAYANANAASAADYAADYAAYANAAGYAAYANAAACCAADAAHCAAYSAPRKTAMQKARIEILDLWIAGLSDARKDGE